MFAFHLFNTVTNHTAWQHLFKIYIIERLGYPPTIPPTPDMIVFIYKSAYFDYNGLNKSCTSNLGYQDYQKRHKQTGCTKNSAEAFCYTTNPSKVSSALNVLINP